MKQGWYVALMLGLIPIQTTVLDYASIGGIRPDLCLIAAFLVGFVMGEGPGGMTGMALGFLQDLFSAGQLWINLLIKGIVGLLGSLFGRHLANATAVSVMSLLFMLSAVSGAMFTAWFHAGNHPDFVTSLQTSIIPQALYDAAVGGLLYWLVPHQRGRHDEFVDEVTLFGR
jgi:cell shape-determining protein MreD